MSRRASIFVVLGLLAPAALAAESGPAPGTPETSAVAPDPVAPDASPAEPGPADPPPAEDALPAAAETPTEETPEPEPPRTWQDPDQAVAEAKTNPPPSSQPEKAPSEALQQKPRKDPKGFGATILGAITISPASGHAWANGECPSTIIDGSPYARSCSATPPAGVSGEGRFGYMFGLFGAELYGQLATDYVNATLDVPSPIAELPDYATQMHLARVGVGGGAQLRFKTVPSQLRFSAGFGGGFMYRAVFSNVSSLDGSWVNYVAPVLRADVGLVAFSVLTFGINGWVEFVDSVSVSPDFSNFGNAGQALQDVMTDTVVYRGPQVVFGLFGGLHFGK